MLPSWNRNELHLTGLVAKADFRMTAAEHLNESIADSADLVLMYVCVL